MAVNGLVKVFFADGVHLIYGYEGGKYWCRKRVCVKSAYGRKRINCLGFLDAVSHKVETVMNDTYLNSDSVCEGLKKVRQNNPDEWLYVVLDNAAYQRCKKVKECAAELRKHRIISNHSSIKTKTPSKNAECVEKCLIFHRKGALNQTVRDFLAARYRFANANMIFSLAVCFRRPRYRVFRYRKIFFMTAKTCSTLQRTDDF